MHAAIVAMGGVSQNGDGNFDGLINILYRVFDKSSDIAVADHQVFLASGSAVKSGNLRLGYIHLRFCIITVGDCKYHPCQIQLFPYNVHFFVVT